MFESSMVSFHLFSFSVSSPLFTNFLTKTKDKRPVNETTGNHFQFLMSVAEKYIIWCKWINLISKRWYCYMGPTWETLLLIIKTKPFNQAMLYSFCWAFDDQCTNFWHKRTVQFSSVYDYMLFLALITKRIFKFYKSFKNL